MSLNLLYKHIRYGTRDFSTKNREFSVLMFEKLKQTYVIALSSLAILMIASFAVRESFAKAQSQAIEFSGQLAVYSISVARFGQTLTAAMKTMITHEGEVNTNRPSVIEIQNQSALLIQQYDQLLALGKQIEQNVFSPLDVNNLFFNAESKTFQNLSGLVQLTHEIQNSDPASWDWRFGVWAPIALQVRENGPLLKALTETSNSIQTRTAHFAMQVNILSRVLLGLKIFIVVFEVVYLFLPLLRSSKTEHERVLSLNKVLKDNAIQIQFQRELILEVLDSVQQSIRIYMDDDWIDLGAPLRNLALPKDPNFDCQSCLDLMNHAKVGTQWQLMKVHENLGRSIEFSIDISDLKGTWFNLKRLHLPGENHALLTTNISQLKETEEALHHAQKLETLGNLTSGIAHDFNNILGVILGNLELMQITADDPKALETFIQNSINTTHRATAIVNSLQSLSRKNTKFVKSISISNVLAEVKLIALTALPSDITLQINQAINGTILIDAAELQSAILNLILNARDEMQDGGVIQLDSFEAGETLKIQNGLCSDQDYVCLQVTDQGKGIPEEIFDKIASSFFTTKETGTGLGLAMISNFVKHSDGALFFHNNPNGGATFGMLFKLEKNALNEAGHSGAATRKSAISNAYEGKLALIIEDEEDLIPVIEQNLKSFGFKTVSFRKIKDARAFIDYGQMAIDLIVVDYNLPDGRGTEFLKYKSTTLANCPMVLISGTDWNEKKLKEVIKFDHVATKPLARDELITMIEKLVKKTSVGTVFEV